VRPRRAGAQRTSAIQRALSGASRSSLSKQLWNRLRLTLSLLKSPQICCAPSPAGRAWAEDQQADLARHAHGGLANGTRPGLVDPAVDYAGSARALSCQKLGRRGGLRGMILEWSGRSTSKVRLSLQSPWPRPGTPTEEQLPPGRRGSCGLRLFSASAVRFRPAHRVRT
jgi:hypothetical protein